MKILILCIALLTPIMGHTENYIIYSIAHEIPMENDFKEMKKNYYINMGSSQGVQRGTVLKVFRTISRQDPYENKRRYKYSVPIGQLKVVHSEGKAAIAVAKALVDEEGAPLFEVRNFMVGDRVSVDVGD
jgi:hypothetical protein